MSRVKAILVAIILVVGILFPTTLASQATVSSRDVAGSYSVDVNGLSSSFTVKEKPAPALAPPPAPPAKPPINWPLVGPLVGGIIAVLVVVGLLIFFLIRSRRGPY